MGTKFSAPGGSPPREGGERGRIIAHSVPPRPSAGLVLMFTNDTFARGLGGGWACVCGSFVGMSSRYASHLAPLADLGGCIAKCWSRVFPLAVTSCDDAATRWKDTYCYIYHGRRERTMALIHRWRPSCVPTNPPPSPPLHFPPLARIGQRGRGRGGGSSITFSGRRGAGAPLATLALPPIFGVCKLRSNLQ